jgi:vitamin B12/bleomycin/antimicrobial peptide transport system ATP-binding/permease protein
MVQRLEQIPSRRAVARRFWLAARQFWLGPSRRLAWALTIGNVLLILLQLAAQFRLNVWNRDIFNALEQKDGAAVWHQAVLFVPLTVAIVGFGVVAVYGRMTTQRKWREWLTEHLVARLLAHGHYYQLNLVRGDHKNPEARISQDARVATDPPVDFAVGIFYSIVTAATFIGVLWVVGGNLALDLAGMAVVIPGYLVLAAIVYSVLASAAMVVIARRFVAVSEATNQAEAEFRYALTRLSDNGESIALLDGEKEEQEGLRKSLGSVLHQWLLLCYQHMRATVVSNGNSVLAPVVPLILCAPKYLDGSMSLGEVMQAAGAFVQVQSSFNWLVDNYPRLADWMASVRRVGSLIASLDYLEAVGRPGEPGMIKRIEYDASALRLRDLSVTLEDGTVVINDADVIVEPGERILVMGESGTGKSTLVRAIAGLWPWGKGEIFIPRKAKLFLMPQYPYVPLGDLRRVVTYPLSSSQVDDGKLRELMNLVGLDHLVDRLDEQASWEYVLSGGERQRVAFVRLLLHEPDFVVMDEATSALDPSSQEQLLTTVTERLARAAIISIAHRPELQAFHQRLLVFEHRPGGSRLISDGHIVAPPIGLLPQIVSWLHAMAAA